MSIRCRLFSYFLFVIISICKYPVIQPMAAMVFIIKYLSKYLSISAVTPFIDRSEGWSLRSVGILDQSQQKCVFFRRNSNPLQIFQLQPKKETSSSSMGDRLEKKIHNFPIKSSHLCRTSRHVWLSSSACDHCLLRLPTNLHLKLETLLG